MITTLFQIRRVLFLGNDVGVEPGLNNNLVQVINELFDYTFKLLLLNEKGLVSGKRGVRHLLRFVLGVVVGDDGGDGSSEDLKAAGVNLKNKTRIF